MCSNPPEQLFFHFPRIKEMYIYSRCYIIIFCSFELPEGPGCNTDSWIKDKDIFSVGFDLKQLKRMLEIPNVFLFSLAFF